MGGALSARLPREAPAEAAGELPLAELAVSVVVPTMGRPQLLQRCLLALLRQSCDPQAYEIVVANDRPDAATHAAVTDLQRLHPRAQLRYLPVTGGTGPAHARNAGWRFARAPVIAFTDDDTLPDPDWLADGLRALQRENAAAVSGNTVVPLADAPTDYERDAAGLERAEFVTANCFLRREALVAVGGFDERFRAAWREDSDLQFALLEQGRRVVRAPDAIVVHPVRPAGFGVSLRQQRKLQFDALLYKKHPQLYRTRIRARPRWDYYFIVVLLALGLYAAATGAALPAALALALWTALTLRFCAKRLDGTSREPRHVAEMLLTSVAIPPVAVFWRLVGCLRYRVLFA